MPTKPNTLFNRRHAGRMPFGFFRSGSPRQQQVIDAIRGQSRRPGHEHRHAGRVNLAWKVSLVIGGVCKPTLLDSYSVERGAVGDRLLRNASRMTDAAVMRNPIAQGLRNAVV